MGERWIVCSNPQHNFGTDAFLLADFARVRRHDRVCDLGTGCGILPVLLDKFYRPDYILAVEIQKDAVQLAQQSVKWSSLCAQVEILNMDFRYLPGREGEFDKVVCNPPYQAIGRGKVNPDRSKSMARHELNGTIFDVCKAAAKLLRNGGDFYLCQRTERLADTVCALRQSGLEPKRMQFCAKDDQTPPWMFLMEAKKRGKPFLTAMPTMQVYAESGEFSEEMKRIYQQEEKE